MFYWKCFTPKFEKMILLFFWVYGFDLLEDSMEEMDFEWIFVYLFAEKM